MLSPSYFLCLLHAGVLPGRYRRRQVASCDRHHVCIGLGDTGRAHVAGLKRDAYLQHAAGSRCSTGHDGLLAPGATGAPPAASAAAEPPEIPPHSWGAVGCVEYSSKTLAPCLPLCRKCNASALWRPFVGVHQRSRFQHARVQPRAHQPQYASIIDPLLDACPQRAPVQGIEKSPDSRLDSPSDGQRPALLTPRVQRVMGTMALPATVGKGLEILREDGFQDPHHCALDDRVREAGLPYGPLLSAFLLDPYPLDRRRPIPIVAPPLMQVPPGVIQGLGILRRRDVVHAWGTALLRLVRGFQSACPVDHVRPIVAYHRWRVLGLLGNALECHGDGW